MHRFTDRRAVRVAAGLALAALVGFVLGACAGRGPASREARFRGEFPLEPESGAYQARVPLPFALRSEEGVDRLEIPLGDGAMTMGCFVHDAELELGVAALQLLEAGREQLAALGNFPQPRLSGARVGAVGDAAYHALEWTYGDASGAAALKAAVANKQGYGIACLDLNLGFHESFRSVFEGLVASFEAALPPPEPYFQEVLVSRVGELEVGVTSIALTRDAEGDTEIRAVNSVVIPDSAHSVHVSYSRRVAWSRPDGTLINAYSTERDLESEHTALALGREERGWRVRGTFQGKPLDARLARDVAIHSALGEYLWIRDRLLPRGDERVIRLLEWIPDADPTRLTEAVCEVTPADPTRIVMRVGPLESHGRRGPDGLLETGVVRLGPSEMHTEVVHRRGAL